MTSPSPSLINLGFTEVWDRYTHPKAHIGAFLDLLPSIDMWIAGGFVRKLVHNEPLGDSDVDFWAADSNAYAIFDNFLYYNYNAKIPMGTTQLAITRQLFGFKIQQIKYAYWLTVDHIFNEFDFTVCQFAYSLKNNNFITYPKALEDLNRHQLRLNPDRREPTTAMRFIKYCKSGFAPATMKEAQGLIDSITFKDLKYSNTLDQNMTLLYHAFIRSQSARDNVLTLVPKALRGRGY